MWNEHISRYISIFVHFAFTFIFIYLLISVYEFVQLHATMTAEFLNNFKIPDYILVPNSSKVQKFHECDLVVPDCPVLVFINSKSGGQLGGDLLLTYRALLNEKQVSLVLHELLSLVLPS